MIQVETDKGHVRGIKTVFGTGIFESSSVVPAGFKRLAMRWYIGTILLGVLTVSSRALAQDTLVIDINVFGLTINQTTTINQLDQACTAIGNGNSDQEQALLALCGEIDQLDPNDSEDIPRLQDIADAVAVEEAFAVSDSLAVLTDFQTTNVRARLDALRQSPGPEIGQAPSQTTVDTPSGGASSGDVSSRLGGFINGHISSGDTDGGQLQQDSDISSSSLTLGADYRFSGNVIAGLGVGVQEDESRFTSVTGSVDSDGFNVTAFASWYESDEGYLDIVLDIGQTAFDLRRSISLEPTVSMNAVSSLDSNATTVSVSGGRNFRPFDWDLGAYFRLSYARATVDAYEESLSQEPTGFAALFSIAEQSVQSTKMVLGLELSKAFSTQKAVLVPLLRLEYVSENERTKDDIEATLLISGTPFRYQGEEREGSYTNLGIGASAVMANGRSAYAFYETHLQHETISQDWIKAGVRLEF